jgi:hypothetical protein
MVQVQVTSFALVDRNPQVFMNIFTAKPQDYKKATQRVYLSTDRPSRIEASDVLTNDGPIAFMEINSVGRHRFSELWAANRVRPRQFFFPTCLFRPLQSHFIK